MISQICGFVNEAFAPRSVRGIGWCLQNEKHPFGCFVLRCVGKKDVRLFCVLYFAFYQIHSVALSIAKNIDKHICSAFARQFVKLKK